MRGMMTTFIILTAIFGARPSFAADFSAYLEDLGRGRREKPVVDLERGGRAAQPDRRFEKTELASAPSQVEFVEGRWESQDTEPRLIVRNAGALYHLRLGSRFYYSSVTEEILRRLELPTASRRFVRDLKVRIDPASKIRLGRFLSKIPARFDWTKNFVDVEEGIVVLAGVLETPERINGSWSWTEAGDSREARMLLLALSWLQCNVIQPEGNHARTRSGHWFVRDLRGCLGIGVSVSSPNMFGESWVERVGRNSLKFDSPYLDRTYLQAFQNLTRQDIESFYRRAARIKDWAAVFTAAGFPRELAWLYDAKLIARLNTLGRGLGLEPGLVADPRGINAPPQIEAGQVVADYPGFPVDLTQNALEELLWEMGKTVLKPIDSLAQQLISTMPYAELQLGQIGRAHFAPGFMFRMHRTVVDNPKPTGPGDMFLVRDEIDLMVSFGLGIDMEHRFGSAGISAGPGYRKMYVKITPAASRKEAKGIFWTIPYDVMWNSDFDTLNKGEVLAIQHGFIGMSVVSGNLLRGYLVRPTGYVMGSYENLGLFQVARLNDGGLILVDGALEDFFVQTKAYWRVYNRYFRVPFAAWNWQSGEQEARFVTIPASSWNSPDDHERISARQLVRAAIEAWSLDPLTVKWQVSRRTSDFSAVTSFYNFYLVHGNWASSEMRVSIDGRPGEVEVVRAMKSYVDRWTGADRAWRCDAAALLDRIRPDDWPHDGYLRMDCTIALENASLEDLRFQVQKIEETLNVKIPLEHDPGREVEARLRLEIPWRSFQPFLQDDATGWVKTSLDELLAPPDEDETGQDMLKRLPRFHLMTLIAAIRSARDPSARLSQLLETLVSLGIQEPILGDLLREIPDERFELKFFDQTALSTANMENVLGRGPSVRTPLRDLYQDHFLSYENPVVNSF